MAKLYALASLKAKLQPTETIKCSDCGQTVPLLDMGAHVCSSDQRLRTSPATSPSDEEPSADNLFRKNAKAAGLKIMTAAAKTYSGSRSLPSSASLSPALPITPLTSSSWTGPPPIPGTSNNNNSLSPWTMQRKGSSDGSSTHSNDSALNSPSLSPSPSNKLPFFEKYQKIYGTGAPSSSASSLPLSPRPSQTFMPPSKSTYSVSKSSSASSVRTSGSASSMHSSPSTSVDLSAASAFIPELRKASPSSPYPHLASQPPNNLNQQRGIASRPGAATLLATSMQSNKAPPPTKPYFMGGLKPSKSEPLGLSQATDSDALPRQQKKSASPKGSLAQLDDLLEDFSLEGAGSEGPTTADEDPFDLSSYMLRPLSANGDDITPKLSSSSTFDDVQDTPHRVEPTVRPLKASTSHRTQTYRCKQCRLLLDNAELENAVQSESGFMCSTCYGEMYLPKCRKCRKPIRGKATGSGDGKVKGKFHPECFTCFSCDEPFPNKEFYVWDERPFCSQHYHEMAGSCCLTCHQGIEGACVTLVVTDDAYKRYHPACFQCSHASCKQVLAEYHYFVDGRPWCLAHAQALTEESTADAHADSKGNVPGSSSARPKQLPRKMEKRRTVIAPVVPQQRRR